MTMEGLVNNIYPSKMTLCFFLNPKCWVRGQGQRCHCKSKSGRSTIKHQNRNSGFVYWSKIITKQHYSKSSHANYKNTGAKIRHHQICRCTWLGRGRRPLGTPTSAHHTCCDGPTGASWEETRRRCRELTPHEDQRHRRWPLDTAWSMSVYNDHAEMPQ